MSRRLLSPPGNKCRWMGAFAPPLCEGDKIFQRHNAVLTAIPSAVYEP